MDIRILKDKKNALLNRRELDFVVKYEGSTPSRSDIRNKLAAMLNAPLELLVIQRIKTEFGMQEAKGYAKLYEDAARMKEVELEFVLKRNAIPGVETEGEEA
jgi:small subunit ribosomal protein S24e